MQNYVFYLYFWIVAVRSFTNSFQILPAPIQIINKLKPVMQWK